MLTPPVFTDTLFSLFCFKTPCCPLPLPETIHLARPSQVVDEAYRRGDATLQMELQATRSLKLLDFKAQLSSPSSAATAIVDASETMLNVCVVCCCVS